MKEITRIHIAKTAYDIEIAAKKELESYISALERYAEDPSILEDIEIRITELLQENGTTKDDVITARDIASVRERLGEPHEFAEDSGIAVLSTDSEVRSRRRLYRDQDHAVISGVLAGIATYFGINPLWTRLIFIALLIASFGTMAIVYVVLWIVVPSARTAAEKLELEGKPVTLAAIKARSERFTEGAAVNQTARTVQRVLLFCLGVSFALVAAIALIATVIAAIMTFGAGRSDDWQLVSQGFQPTELFWVSYILCALSGLLFAALNAVLAVATFTRNWTKRIGIAVAVMIVAGIITFSSAIGGAMYGSWRATEGVRASLKTTTEPLSKEFTATKTLTIDLSDTLPLGTPSVVYVVSSETPRIQVLHAKDTSPAYEIVQDGDTAKITIKNTKNWTIQRDAPITIYGPALEEIQAQGGETKYTNTIHQDSLAIRVTTSGRFAAEGEFDHVDARTESGSTIRLDAATVKDLRATTKGGFIEAGVVRTLYVSQSEACPSSNQGEWDEDTVKVEKVSSNEFTYNKNTRSVHDSLNLETACGRIVIGKE